MSMLGLVHLIPEMSVLVTIHLTPEVGVGAEAGVEGLGLLQLIWDAFFVVS